MHNNIQTEMDNIWIVFRFKIWRFFPLIDQHEMLMAVLRVLYRSFKIPSVYHRKGLQNENG